MVYYENMNYKDALNAVDASSTVFDCDSSCKFLSTLAEDGYDEFLRAASEDRSFMSKSGLTSDYCTGDIYVEGRDIYCSISIHKYKSNKYGVQIDIRPASFVRTVKESTIESAIAKMEG